MQKIKVGIIGFGTVGAGVVEGLQKNGALMAERTGILPIVTKIADLDVTTDRGVTVPEGTLTTDAMALIADDSVDLIVELVGGTTIAKTFTLEALKRGKPVITANKALLAEHGAELYRVAQENQTGIYYEAAVGGGIPILRSQRDGLVGNQIESIYGILNGTCNYILTRMENEGLPFDEILADAQKLGYAETPPDLDIDGIDTAHKTTILASMAFGAPVPLSACSASGIRGLAGEEITHASALGYRIKLLAIITETDGKIALSVEPTLVPKTHMTGMVSDSFNAVFVRGDLVGDTLYYGRGAGRLPTGSAVIGDIMEAAADKLNGNGTPVCIRMMLQRETLDYCPADELEKQCYIRFSLADSAGSWSAVEQILSQNKITISERTPTVDSTVVLLTNSAPEAAYKKALAEIKAADLVKSAPVRMRLETF